MEFIARACAKTNARVHAYCLMTNHYHLLVETPDANLDEVMRLAWGKYVRYFNDKYGKDGRLCRDRYKAILIDSDEYLLAVSRYIHRNPLAFWDKPLEEYRWSSYAAFTGDRPHQVWLEIDQTLEVAGGTWAYRSLVSSPLPSEVDQLYEARSRLPTVLGAASFRERVGQIARTGA